MQRGALHNSSDPGTGKRDTDGDGLPALSSWPNGGESSGTSVGGYQVSGSPSEKKVVTLSLLTGYTNKFDNATEKGEGNTYTSPAYQVCGQPSEQRFWGAAGGAVTSPTPVP